MIWLLFAIAMAWTGYKYAIRKGYEHPVRRGAISGALFPAMGVVVSLEENYFRKGDAKAFLTSAICWLIAFVLIVRWLEAVESRRLGRSVTAL